MRDLVRRAAGIAAAGAIALAAGMVAAAPGAASAAAAPSVTAVEAVLPANAAANTVVYMGSVSCPSAGSCTAVGSYLDSSGSRQGLLLTETSGTWATGVEAPLPADANAPGGQDARLVSVSCASAGNCTAVGFYANSSGPYQGLLLTETSGTWATGVEAVPPADAAAYADAIPVSVSCASAGNCTAVGSYTDSSNNVQGLLLTETSGTWATGVEAALPANAAARGGALSSVSCASAGNCTAVGSYTDSSGSQQGLLLTETSGTWATGVEAALPANAAARGGALSSVSCASAGNCTAVGSYTDSSNNEQGLLLTETSGTWATGVEAALPANAAAYLEPIPQVSCASAGNCTAVGYYEDSSDNEQGLLLTETSGTWATGAEAALPANSAANPGVTFYSRSGCAPVVACIPVSCASAGSCTAVGHYVDSSGYTQGLLLTETSGTWATGVEAPLPANAAADPDVDLSSVSCASAGNCTAVGHYVDSSGNFQGLLVSQTATQPTTTALVSSADPSAVGQAVTYTATVRPAPGGGTVAFTDGTSVIAGCGAQPVSTSTGQATCQNAPATAGAHNITAAFSGSDDFAGSTSPILTQVVTTTPCSSLAGCNLHGLNLTAAQLSGANLSGANLSSANLTGADLSGANLGGANLSSANLTDADLSGANLTGANLNSANLTGADLTGANLSGANLNKANLTGADLSGANVTGANFDKVTWSNTTCPDGTNSDADAGTCIGHL